MAMPPSSTVFGCQHDTKYVTFKVRLLAAFVVNESWGFMLEPARILSPYFGAVTVYVPDELVRGYYFTLLTCGLLDRGQAVVTGHR